MREHYFRFEAAGQQKLEQFIASRLTRREQMNRFRTAFDDFVLYSMADFGVPPAFRLDEVAAPFVQPYSDVVDELWNLQKVRSPFDKVKHLGSNHSTCAIVSSINASNSLLCFVTEKICKMVVDCATEFWSKQGPERKCPTL